MDKLNTSMRAAVEIMHGVLLSLVKQYQGSDGAKEAN